MISLKSLHLLFTSLVDHRHVRAPNPIEARWAVHDRAHGAAGYGS